ncbi:hypothetical protein ACXR0O_18035 [Verrucomicrobiota bacterium sgz303538]
MDNEIAALFGFLDRFGVEASGRSISQPEGEVGEKLIRFAYGTCTEEERIEACDLLRAHPAWIRWLADKVKLRRAEARMASSPGI